jgi:hypothetical protein
MSDVDQYAARARLAWAEASRSPWEDLRAQWLSVAEGWRALALQARRREAARHLAEHPPASLLIH